MNPIFAAAEEIQSLCRRRGWRFCFIGGLALQRWGEPRLTQDVDLTVVTGFGGEAAYTDALLEAFPARLDEARDFALRHRVLLLRSAAGIPLAVALGAMPFEERMTDRASAFAVAPGVELRTCSAEDLVISKAFAGRDRDWLDLEGIAVRQSTSSLKGLILSSPPQFGHGISVPRLAGGISDQTRHSGQPIAWLPSSGETQAVRISGPVG